MKNAILKSMAWMQARQSREEGQTAIEYAVLVAIVSIALVLLLVGFGTDIINDAQQAITDQLPLGGS